MKIYTKTGDQGTTALFGGQRIRKDTDLIQLVGEVDELNACLGLAVSTTEDQLIGQILQRLQHELFNLGAEVATPSAQLHKLDSLIDSKQVGRMETDIDELESHLSPIRQFILPGGGLTASTLHLARTVCRRCERKAVSLNGEQLVSLPILQYLNRLSDLLFILARRANAVSGQPDIYWQKNLSTKL